MTRASWWTHGPRAVGSRAQAVARDRALLRLRTRAAFGPVTPDAVADLDERVADLVALARECGAPLAPVVRAALDGVEQRSRAEADLAAAVAPARTVARTLVALPLVAVPVLAAVAGIDLSAFYLHDPAGRAVAIVVVALLVLAMGWIRVVLRSAQRAGEPGGPSRRPWWLAALVVVAWLAIGPVAGMLAAVVVATRLRSPPARPSPHLAHAADLVAVAVSGGHDLPTALRRAGDRLESAASGRGGGQRAVLALALRARAMDLALRPARGCLPREDRTVGAATPSDHLLGPLGDVVDELAHTGAPGVEVLRDLALRLRAQRAADARAGAARLPARLTFPTALVLVPATVLAIGAPIVLQGLARATG